MTSTSAAASMGGARRFAVSPAGVADDSRFLDAILLQTTCSAICRLVLYYDEGGGESAATKEAVCLVKSGGHLTHDMVWE